MPEPDNAAIDEIESVSLSSGDSFWRGHRSAHPPAALVPGLGDTRFAPLADSHHAYFGETRTVALLESALHSASGPDPRIRADELVDWRVSRVELTTNLTVADLRDSELERLGIMRNQLVSTLPMHYRCTRAWAWAVRTAGFDGIVWHSRQADLHAAAHTRGLLGDLLVHAAIEVAVVWANPGANPLNDGGDQINLIEPGRRPHRLLAELSALIGVPIIG